MHICWAMAAAEMRQRSEPSQRLASRAANWIAVDLRPRNDTETRFFLSGLVAARNDQPTRCPLDWPVLPADGRRLRRAGPRITTAISSPTRRPIPRAGRCAGRIRQAEQEPGSRSRGSSVCRRGSWGSTKRSTTTTCRSRRLAKLRSYLDQNDLADVSIYVNCYDPKEQWHRLKENKRIGAGWRYSLGTLSMVGLHAAAGPGLRRRRLQPLSPTACTSIPTSRRSRFTKRRLPKTFTRTSRQALTPC